jgi:hypothetical protein
MSRMREERERTTEEGAAGMATSGGEGGQDLAGAPVRPLQEDLRERAVTADVEGRSSVDELPRASDPAGEWLDQHAREAGIGINQHRREAGIMTVHQERQIKYWEVPINERD